MALGWKWFASVFEKTGVYSSAEHNVGHQATCCLHLYFCSQQLAGIKWSKSSLIISQLKTSFSGFYLHLLFCLLNTQNLIQFFFWWEQVMIYNPEINYEQSRKLWDSVIKNYNLKKALFVCFLRIHSVNKWEKCSIITKYCKCRLTRGCEGDPNS